MLNPEYKVQSKNECESEIEAPRASSDVRTTLVGIFNKLIW